MSGHERKVRERLEAARHTKLNRYSEMHFDAPVRDAGWREVLNEAAMRDRYRSGARGAFFAVVLAKLIPEDPASPPADT